MLPNKLPQDWAAWDALCYVHGFCGLGIWIQHSGDGLSLFHEVWGCSWKTQKLGPGIICRILHSHIWQWMLAIGWGPQFLSWWSRLGFSHVVAGLLKERSRHELYSFYDLTVFYYLHCSPCTSLVSAVTALPRFKGREHDPTLESVKLQKSSEGRGTHLWRMQSALLCKALHLLLMTGPFIQQPSITAMEGTTWGLEG